MQGGRAIKAITLRNLPPALVHLISRKAEEQRTSLNKVVISLLEESLGKGRNKGKKEKPRYHDLEHLAGAWVEDEAAAFDEALAEQRVIDKELWK